MCPIYIALSLSHTHKHIRSLAVISVLYIMHAFIGPVFAMQSVRACVCVHARQFALSLKSHTSGRINTIIDNNYASLAVANYITDCAASRWCACRRRLVWPSDRFNRMRMRVRMPGYYVLVIAFQYVQYIFISLLVCLHCRYFVVWRGCYWYSFCSPRTRGNCAFRTIYDRWAEKSVG